jgi:HAMP domain-containing protein
LDGFSNRQTKNQPIREAIKLFKSAAKALAGTEEDEPAPRRKSGESEGEFRRLARYLWRRFDARLGFKMWAGITRRTVAIDPAAHAVAAEYLASSLDTLNQLDDGPGSDYGDGFNAISNFNSPNL